MSNAMWGTIQLWDLDMSKVQDLYSEKKSCKYIAEGHHVYLLFFKIQISKTIALVENALS
uniref:Uncharacterized protein n=1 Tax=Rhizophora mucronata TaxID=61149 RepID=A0A2P2QEB8_RHIMU